MQGGRRGAGARRRLFRPAGRTSASLGFARAFDRPARPHLRRRTQHVSGRPRPASAKKNVKRANAKREQGTQWRRPTSRVGSLQRDLHDATHHQLQLRFSRRQQEHHPRHHQRQEHGPRHKPAPIHPIHRVRCHQGSSDPQAQSPHLRRQQKCPQSSTAAMSAHRRLSRARRRQWLLTAGSQELTASNGCSPRDLSVRRQQ